MHEEEKDTSVNKADKTSVSEGVKDAKLKIPRKILLALVATLIAVLQLFV